VFAIDGVVAFWIPLVGTFLWVIGQTVLFLRALKVQEREEDAESGAGHESELSTPYDTATR
jgi:hypothetical protein